MRFAALTSQQLAKRIEQAAFHEPGSDAAKLKRVAASQRAKAQALQKMADHFSKDKAP